MPVGTSNGTWLIGGVPPNTAIATANKQAHEFQLVNETTTAGYLNFLLWATRYPYNDVGPTYTSLLLIAHDGAAVLDYLDLHLTANQLSAETRTVIGAVITAANITAGSSRDAKLNMLASVCFLILASPEYLVQK